MVYNAKLARFHSRNLPFPLLSLRSNHYGQFLFWILVGMFCVIRRHTHVHMHYWEHTTLSTSSQLNVCREDFLSHNIKVRFILLVAEWCFRTLPAEGGGWERALSPNMTVGVGEGFAGWTSLPETWERAPSPLASSAGCASSLFSVSSPSLALSLWPRMQEHLTLRGRK